MPNSGGPTSTTLVRYPDERLTDAIIELADLHKATLGLMPAGAIRALAARGDALAAVDQTGDLAGYALSSVARGRVRLIHLCVAPAHRGHGIAQQLVRRLSQDHASLAGIVLKCRRDYRDATQLWKSLDFTPRAELPGRGNNGATLTVWWLSHGIPDLFTLADEPLTTPVAIDHNIFIDLAVDRGRPGADESLPLEADWLREQITLRATKESAREIERNPEAKSRARQLSALTGFEPLDYPPSAHEKAKSAWERVVGDVPKSDRSDCNHIVSAGAAGVKIFLTRDNRLIEKYAEPAADVFGIRVLHPLDLIVHLDELADATRYQPADLRGTGFQVALRGSGGEADLDALLAYGSGERKTAFHTLQRRLGSDPSTSRWWVRDPSGGTVAAWAVRVNHDRQELEVPLMRSVASTVGTTLGRLIEFQLRKDALDQNLQRIVVTDTHLMPHTRADLLAEGYRQVDAHLAAAVLDVRSRDAAMQAMGSADPLGAQIQQALADATTPERLLALERALWPAKLLDTNLASYLVPIQPRWASDLFLLRDTLWAEPGLLNLSREHVYYRTPGRGLQVPARIAWYASGKGKPDGIGAVVAVSHLVQLDTAPPEHLFRRYQRLGVYKREDVLGSGRDGLASAMRFVDTENLPRQISYDRLWELSGGTLTTLQSPLKISGDFFGAIYDEGTRRPEVPPRETRPAAR